MTGGSKAHLLSHVYFAEDTITGLVKIGYSTAIRTRMASLSAQTAGHSIRLLASARGDHTTEGSLHWIFRDDRVHGEWFRRSPAMDALIDFVNKFPSIRAFLPYRVLGGVA